MKTIKKKMIQKPSILLGHRSEIEPLFKLTNGTRDIKKCSSWSDFVKLVKKLSKIGKKFCCYGDPPRFERRVAG